MLHAAIWLRPFLQKFTARLTALYTAIFKNTLVGIESLSRHTVSSAHVNLPESDQAGARQGGDTQKQLTFTIMHLHLVHSEQIPDIRKERIDIMNSLQENCMRTFLIVMLAFAVPIVASARSLPDDEPKHFLLHAHPGRMDHSRHCKDDGDMRRYPDSLGLSESQQDKIFSITTAQSGKLYELDKIVRNAYFDLHKLATSGQYDDGKAVAISDSLAKARATIALIHAREEQQIYALLTKEQRDLLSSQHAGQSAGKSKGTTMHGSRQTDTRHLHIF